MSELMNSQTPDVEDIQEEFDESAAPEAAEVVSGAKPEPGDEPEEKVEKKLVVKSPFDEKRADIYKRVAEKNAESRGKEFVSNHDPANLYGKDAVESTAAKPDQPIEQAKSEAPVAAEQPDAPAQQEQLVEVIVDGVRQKLPLSQVVATAQKNMAADARLEEAKRIARELKEMRQASPSQFAQPEPTPQPEARNPAPREDLKDVVEKLQLGSIDEGVEALERVLSRVAQPQAQEPQNLDRELYRIEDERESKRVLRDLDTHVPEVKDEFFQAVLHKSVEREMRAEIAAVAGIPDDEAARYSAAQIAQMHRAMRIDPRTQTAVRSVRDLTQAGLETAYQWFQQRGAASPPPPPPPPTTQVQVQARQERKQALQPQPAPRTQPSFSQQPETRSTSDVIKAMRKARGKDY